MAKYRGITEDEQEELQKVKSKKGPREDLDEDNFDLDKYGAEFDLNDELAAPVQDEDDFDNVAKPAVEKPTKKVSKASSPKTGKKPSVLKSKEKKEKEAIAIDTSPAVAAAAVASPPFQETSESARDNSDPITSSPSPGAIPPMDPIVRTPEDEGGGWWIAVLIILILVASGVVYRYTATDAPVSAEQCTVAYLSGNQGAVLDLQTAAGGERDVLLEALREKNPRNAVASFRSLACPNTNDSCTNPHGWVVLSENSLKQAVPSARIVPCTRAGNTLSCGQASISLDDLNVTGRDLSTLTLITANDSETAVYEDLNAPALTVYNSGAQNYAALETDAADQETMAVRLFVGDPTVQFIVLSYVTSNPRIVTWEFR